MKLSDKKVKLLNSKKALKHMLSGSETLDLSKTINYVSNEVQMKKLQEELIKLQNWVIENKQKVIILFEGRDAAGKGGAIRRFTHYLNPRMLQKIALPKPSEDEEGQWYFQRYINRLPKKGEIVFFDRSWYNRAIVEPVNGFCTQKQYDVFMNQVNDFEKMLVDDDIYLIKFYFSISKGEQAKRFEKIKKDPLKKWKMSPVDERAQELWDVYTDYKKVMFQKTDTDFAPWTVLRANKKIDARLTAIKHVLSLLPYKPLGKKKK
ncbi:MAG: polyphosphate kinase 2 [Chitinophagales bacterium]